MKNLIEQLEFHAQNTPKTAVLFDEQMPKGISYEELDNLSGRVYGWLKAQNIGKEDFVLINLPRGVLPVVAIIGILKDGAAFALVEDNYAPERIAYIRNDCGCKAEINRDAWEKILKTEPLFGHENTDDHDAAYAIYTSGTTGNPKGVLHEYGNITECIRSVNYGGEALLSGKDRGALLSPMNFVASIMVIFYALYNGECKEFIASYATIKNPLLLKKMFLEKRISITFLTPSYVRMLSGQTGPFLKKLIVGSEPANNVYLEKVDIYNMYAMSESGFVVGVFKIDKPYSTCPIGKPQFDLEYMLLDEDGNPVPDGEMGELCFRNEYVRGYINLPEETAKAFVNGIYHSGDLAKKLPDGNLVLLGRSNDMIKINGNRIEPAEIEAAVKQALGIDWVAAKGFENGSQSYLCAYYTADISIDAEKLRTELLKKLPYYMIPSYYIHIDKIPLKPNGKFDRKALPEPEHADLSSQYAAPTNDTEKALCDAFAKVLKLERVGIRDDFYEMGGDSLGSIEAIVESGLPGLEASMVFRGRTAENIAKLYTESRVEGEESDEEKNAEAMKVPHKLTTEQLYMFDYQLYTPMSTMYNLFSMIKFDKELFELPKLVKALEVAVKSHPALLTKFTFDEDGEIIQSYDPSMMPEITVEKISEFDLNILKDNLVQPFKMIDSRLFRCRVFETEKSAYMFFDVHHTVFDGTSFKVLMKDIAQSYMGMPVPQDYYYLTLKKRENAAHTAFYEESRKYFEERYDGDDWISFPPVDHKTRENEFGQIACEMGITSAELGVIEKRFKVSRNEFFITVAALAVSLYADKPNVKLSWIYNGREDVKMMNTVGLLYRDLPIAFRFDKNQNIGDIFADAHEQVQKAIEHSCYPYVENNSLAVEDDIAALLYQRDIRDAGELGGMEIETVDIRQNKAASQSVLDMEVLDSEDGFALALDFASSRYERETMERFRELFLRITAVLVHADGAEYLTVKSLRDEVQKNHSFFRKVMSVFSKRKRN